MAEDGVRHKVVDNVDDCIKAVDDLLKQPVVAVDCEGINLGKTGPLTLLQVAKLDGFVYLFNVFVEPKVFIEGRLKSFLENRNIVKVFHACSGDSAALKCQFDVMLNNVFDVQRALFIIEKSEGRQLPYSRKLMDVCSRYTNVTSLERKEDVTKDDLFDGHFRSMASHKKAKLDKCNAAYWATKELTPEMIDYACADVRILIPEVYEKLKSIIDDKDLWSDFRERVEYQLNCRWNEAVKSESYEATSVVKKVLHQFESKYSSDIAFADISDEDDIQALKLVRITEIDEFPALVRRLKIEFLKNELKTIEEEMTSQGDSFIATSYYLNSLYAAKRSNSSELKNAAQRLQQRVNEILKKDLIVKYTELTPNNHLKDGERRLLQDLPVSTGTSSAVNPVLRHLYNVVIDSDVDKIETLRLKLRREGSLFRLNDADVRQYKYFISNPGVPSRLKTKAKQFLRELEDAGLMAEGGERHKVVDNVDDCIKAVDDLLKEPVVAVDCEGVHLGKKGPLTLLQVAKRDGFVYLFNVFVEPKVFTEGLLKSFLENKDITKVFHACNNDSAALKCQYAVMVVNVFDVQAAQYIIDKSEGRQLPSHRKLLDLCSLYTDVTSLEGKEEVQAKWYKTDGAYWAKKEFSPEMVDYACADVRILVPEVYDKLKRALDEKKLWAEFKEKVEFELNFRWNENVRDDKNEETMTLVKNILREFSTKYTSNAKLDDITSEDDIQALKQIRMQDAGQFPDIAMKLKNQILKKDMDELDQALTEKADSFVPMGSHFRMLAGGKSSPDPVLSMTARRLNLKLDEILKTDLITKYNETTPGNYISEDEKRFMRRLPSSTGTSPIVNPVLRHLYNVSIDGDVEEIETLRQKFQAEGNRFRLRDGDHRLFKYYISAPEIPFRLKTKAKGFLEMLEKAGIISRHRKRPYRF
ncbi:uncharacterized protein [Haliotis asinina]|uniref:uncharacterized protein n=1 Tax=Haliotis asinina TaxID=109174 RepID=UPI0035318DAC